MFPVQTCQKACSSNTGVPWSDKLGGIHVSNLIRAWRCLGVEPVSLNRSEETSADSACVAHVPRSFAGSSLTKRRLMNRAWLTDHAHTPGAVSPFLKRNRAWRDHQDLGRMAIDSSRGCISHSYAQQCIMEIRLGLQIN